MSFCADIFGLLSCAGWLLGGIAVLAILANRDAERERQKRELRGEPTGVPPNQRMT